MSSVSNQNSWLFSIWTWDYQELACENICFFSLFATGDVLRGGTSATEHRNSILMTQIKVHLINPIVMGF